MSLTPLVVPTSSDAGLGLQRKCDGGPGLNYGTTDLAARPGKNGVLLPRVNGKMGVQTAVNGKTLLHSEFRNDRFVPTPDSKWKPAPEQKIAELMDILRTREERMANGEQEAVEPENTEDELVASLEAMGDKKRRPRRRRDRNEEPVREPQHIPAPAPVSVEPDKLVTFTYYDDSRDEVYYHRVWRERSQDGSRNLLVLAWDTRSKSRLFWPKPGNSAFKVTIGDKRDSEHLMVVYPNLNFTDERTGLRYFVFMVVGDAPAEGRRNVPATDDEFDEIDNAFNAAYSGQRGSEL